MEGRLFKPPSGLAALDWVGGPSVFLAGSIEMGRAPDWQAGAESLLLAAGFQVLNPRRDDWDSSWTQTLENETFVGQVMWELVGLDMATSILMNLVPGTQSPISLLELGLYARSGKLVVCCPAAFWRSGNIKVLHLASQGGFQLFEDLGLAVEAVAERAEKLWRPRQEEGATP